MATITANNGAAGNFQDGTSWVGGVAPTAADDAVLPAGCTSMTIGTGSVCRSLTTTAFTGTLTHTAGVTLTIGDSTAGAGNVALAFGTFTYTLGNAATSAISFVSTSATVQTINFNGKTTGNVTFNATSGGSWQYTGGHTCGATATVTLTKGTLDINGQTCSWGVFDTNNSNTRSLTLGAASITLTGSTAKTWNIDTATNLTLSAASSTITLTGATTTFSAGSSGFGYGSIIISGSGICKAGGGASTSCVNFTRTGTAAKTDILYISTGTNMTCSGTFTCNGNSSINRVLVQGETVGAARTITAATWSITNTDFQDITGAGAGSRDFSAKTDVGDCGGCSGITFPASVAQYYGGVNMNGSYLRCNGISGNYVSTPDSAALSIVSDIELQARVSMDDWTPASPGNFIAKRSTSGANRAYLFQLNAAGTLSLVLSSDGTNNLTIATSSAATGFTDGTVHWVKATYVKSTGVVQFFTADDSTSVPSSWTQLGTDRTTETTGIADTTAPLSIGSHDAGVTNQAIGNFYRARVLNGVGGTVVFDADFTAQSAGTKSFTESSSQGATVSNVITGGNWSASSWTTRVPLPQDDAYLGNAFAASQTVTADMPRLGRSIDWTGATGNPTFTLGLSISFYGSMVLISAMTFTPSTFTSNACGRVSNFTLTSNGKSFYAFNINCPTGTYTLGSNFVSTDNVQLQFGSIDFNSYNFTCNRFLSNLTTTRGLTLGTGTLTITLNSATSAYIVNSTNLTFSGASSTISFNSSASNRTFTGGALQYGTLNYTVAGSTGELHIIDTGNSFAAINFSDANNARSLKFTAATTTTIRNTNGFNVQGTSGKLMTVASITAATHTLTSPGQQSCDYLSVTNSTVDASPKWYAGANSTDGTGNTNWVFEAAPGAGGTSTNFSLLGVG